MLISKPARTALSCLFDKMDQEFDLVANKYGFICRGCDDNCCQSLFFHHTFIEKAYLHYGLARLEPSAQQNILKKAKLYLDQEAFFLEPRSLLQKPMCPLLERGRCSLYTFRPMICRLHGLPHEVTRPGQSKEKHPGCQAGNFVDKPYQVFDRTPFYKEMAKIEMDFRRETGNTKKLRQTIAMMLLDASV